MKRVLLIVIAAVLIAPAAAQPVASTPLATPRPTAQAQYNALVALADAQKWEEAARAAELLTMRIMAMKVPNAVVLASVKLLHASALRGLGREAEALAMATDLIDQKTFATANMPNDVYVTLILAANLHERALDYDLAALRYTAAIDVAPDTNSKLRALAGVGRSLVTVDPVRSGAAVDTALTLVPDDKASKDQRAVFNNLKGRALLNAGRHGEAYTLLDNVVSKLGGLTLRVSQADIAARADAALAAFLANKPDQARRLIAFTGAADLGDTQFEIGNDMRPPPCGGTAGIKPDDVAVIEFSVADDGSVTDVVPIYTSRPGPMGSDFARAVKEWWWKPEVAKAIKPFFRVAVRLQMRCTMATDRPDTNSLLSDAYRAWRNTLSPPGFEVNVRNRLDATAVLKAELAKRERDSGKDAPALLPAIDALIGSGVLPPLELSSLSGRSLAIAAAAGIPDAAFNHLLLRDALLSETGKFSFEGSMRKRLMRLAALKLRPTFMRDTRSMALLDLTIATMMQRLRNFDEALARFRVVGSEVEALPDGDPIKVAALIQLASAEQAAKNNVAANAAFTKSGLSARQCALADSRPPQIGGSGGSFDYPPEALNWGFNGWVVTEYDISAAGKSTNVRPLIAYPPYVFANAANTIVGRFRYRETFRPDGGLSCGANMQRITFRRGG